MRIKYKDGDALLGPEQYFAHGCNAQGVMGSGIAKQVRELYPLAFGVYRQVYLGQNQTLFLGQVIEVTAGDKTIFNCITQDMYGREPDVQYVDYDAVRTCMEYINNSIPIGDPHDGSPYQDVAMPQIGSGLGNGDWKIIEEIIEFTCSNFQPIIYVYNG